MSRERTKVRGTPSFKRSSTLGVLSSALLPVFEVSRNFAECSLGVISRIASKGIHICIVREISPSNSECFRETSSDHSQ